MISIEEAQCTILQGINPLETEKVSLFQGLNRITPVDYIAPWDIPPADKSAMDGYAVRAVDLPEEGDREFQVPGTSWAGRPWLTPIEPGQAVQIMTGAMVPEGADTVVMQEQVERDGDRVRIGSGHHCGQNVRAAGEDVAAGQQVFAAGKLLTFYPGTTPLATILFAIGLGAVLGVGLARGIAALNLNVVRTIFMSWIITLPAGAILSILIFFILKSSFS